MTIESGAVRPMSREKSWLWIGGYVMAYLVASSLDLWTTGLALRISGRSEANAYAAPGGHYSPSKVWIITFLGCAVMAALFAFGARHASEVAERWIRRPFGSLKRPYLNPFSTRHLDRSPLHAIAWAIGFVVFRLLAAVNNLLVVAGGNGPIGGAVRAAGRATSPKTGFALVAGGLYVGLMIAVLPIAAKVIASLTADDGRR